MKEEGNREVKSNMKGPAQDHFLGDHRFLDCRPHEKTDPDDFFAVPGRGYRRE